MESETEPRQFFPELRDHFVSHSN